MTTTTNELTHTTLTAIAISDAAMTAGGDFRATASALARFCTDALVDVATSAYVPAKFNSSFPAHRRATRDEALERIAGWVSYTKLMQWSDAFTAERAYSDSFKLSQEIA